MQVVALSTIVRPLSMAFSSPSSSSSMPLRLPRTLTTHSISPFLRRPSLSPCLANNLSPSPSLHCFASPFLDPKLKRRVSPNAASSSPPPAEASDKEKLAQVAKRLEKTARYFKRLGSLGFWGQLVCTLVSAVILSFSTVVTGKITSPVTFYTTTGGIVAAFVSIFWSFGYIRLSERLQRTANEPAKAPPRADVVKSLKNGIVLNILGMGATILGMQATVGFLVAKALTTSAVPYYQGVSPGQNPVLALDVFLVQASANTILSHFLGLVFSLELLRSVTLPHLEAVPVPRAA